MAGRPRLRKRFYITKDYDGTYSVRDSKWERDGTFLAPARRYDINKRRAAIQVSRELEIKYRLKGVKSRPATRVRKIRVTKKQIKRFNKLFVKKRKRKK